MDIPVDNILSQWQSYLTNIPVFNTDRFTEIQNDPLKGSAELDKLVYNVEKYRASIKSVEQDYNNIIESLNRVREMLSELEDLAEKSKTAVFESHKIFGVFQNAKPIISKEVLNSLQDWVQVLDGKLAEGYLNAVKIGISKLERECTLKLESEKENYFSNCKDYNEWVDLKGQFKALLAKADMLRVKGLLRENSFNKLTEDTRNALYANMVNLDNCRKLVRTFELSLKS